MIVICKTLWNQRSQTNFHGIKYINLIHIHLLLYYYIIAQSQILSTLQIISHLVRHKPTKWISYNQHCYNIYIYSFRTKLWMISDTGTIFEMGYYSQIFIHMNIKRYRYMYIHSHTHTHTHHTHTHTHIYIYIYVYVCVYVCARGGIVIVVGYRRSDSSSNPWRDYFIKLISLRKVWNQLLSLELLG